MRILVYGANDALHAVDGEWTNLSRGGEAVLGWRLPDSGGQPIQSLGLALRSNAGPQQGAVVLDWLRWDGPPDLRLRRPDEPGEFWRRAWVNAVSIFSSIFPQAFRISQDRGEGMIIHGGRGWTDYRIETALTVHLAQYAGVAVRVQGLRRYYAALLVRPGLLRLVRACHDSVVTLAETSFSWTFETPYAFDFRSRATASRSLSARRGCRFATTAPWRSETAGSRSSSTAGPAHATRCACAPQACLRQARRAAPATAA